MFPQARISPEELQHAADLLDRGRSLPAYWYSARHVFDTERRTLFRSTWLYFGQLEKVSEPGSYATETVATMPIVVTCDRKGELHGFFNTCRHRMHEVAQGCGPAKALTCHYHGWRYKLSGELTGVPRSAEIYTGDAEGFEKEKFGLRPVKIETWYGMIFINADLDAPSFAESFAELIAAAEGRGMPQGLVPRHYDVSQVDANWKTLVDNLIECYHCATVHPELAAKVDVSAEATVVTEYQLGSLLLTPLLGEHTEEELRRGSSHSYFLPPNIWVSCKGERGGLIVVIDPVAEHSSRIISVVLAPPDASDAEVEASVASAQLVNHQDAMASSSAQRGYDLDPEFDAYQLPDSERTLRTFARTVLSAVSDSEQLHA